MLALWISLSVVGYLLVSVLSAGIYMRIKPMYKSYDNGPYPRRYLQYHPDEIARGSIFWPIVAIGLLIGCIFAALNWFLEWASTKIAGIK